MAKHPVPKKKTAKAKSAKRYKTFEQKAQRSLRDKVHLTKCKNCGAAKLLHHVCHECGQYRGRQVVDLQKKLDKITKLKA